MFYFLPASRRESHAVIGWKCLFTLFYRLPVPVVGTWKRSVCTLLHCQSAATSEVVKCLSAAVQDCKWRYIKWASFTFTFINFESVTVLWRLRSSSYRDIIIIINAENAFVSRFTLFAFLLTGYWKRRTSLVSVVAILEVYVVFLVATDLVVFVLLICETFGWNFWFCWLSAAAAKV